jgi:serine protease
LAVGSATITATSDGKSGTAAVTVAGNSLTLGQSVTGLANGGSFTLWTLSVPAGTTRLVVRVSGGTGDADLYVRRGETVSAASYDCRSWNYSTNNEICSFDAPAAGVWSIGVEGAYSGVTLEVNPTPDVITLGQSVTALTSSNKFNLWTLDVPVGTTRLVVTISGGTGDADLYVRRGETVSTTSYSCRSWNYSTNNEICSFDAPAAGVWTIGVSGTYSGVTLDVR